MVRDKIIGLLRIFGVLAIIAAMICGVFLMDNRGVESDVELIFVGTVNDADCTIILSGESCILIDTGEAQDSEHIVQTLESHGVEQIDCVILTHPDKDHVGGASDLLDHFAVTQIVTPYFSGEKAVYTDLLQKAEKMNIPVQSLYRSRLYTYGDLNLRIFAPEKFYYEKSNNYSLAVYVEHGENKLFWAGDAQKERIEELLSLELEPVDLYHVAYHGRDTAISGQLIDMLKPKYAIVTANSPEKETSDLLNEYDTEIVTTAGCDCIFVSDGEKIELTEKIELKKS